MAQKSNTYIFEVSQFTEEDAELGQKIDKNDRIIFMPNESGMIPYMLVPALLSWKVSPIFMEPVDGPMDEKALAFLLGLQSAGCNGFLNICMENNPFQALDDNSFETEKGMVTIHCCSNLKEALDRNVKKAAKMKAIENQEEDDNEADNAEGDENTGQGDESTPLFVKEPSENAGKEEPDEYDIGKEDESSYPEAPESFKKKVKELQRQTALDLEGHVNALYECVRNNPEGVFPALNFQLGMRFREEVVAELADLISENDEELKAAL